jgi:hypothetical protein
MRCHYLTGPQQNCIVHSYYLLLLTNTTTVINATTITNLLQIDHTEDEIMRSSGAVDSRSDEPTDKDELIAHLRAQCNHVRTVFLQLF